MMMHTAAPPDGNRWEPASLSIGTARWQVQGQGREFFAKLRPKMRPGRAHLVPAEVLSSLKY